MIFIFFLTCIWNLSSFYRVLCVTAIQKYQATNTRISLFIFPNHLLYLMIYPGIMTLYKCLSAYCWFYWGPIYFLLQNHYNNLTHNLLHYLFEIVLFSFCFNAIKWPSFDIELYRWHNYNYLTDKIKKTLANVFTRLSLCYLLSVLKYVLC